MGQGSNLVSEESKNNRCQFLGVGFFQHKDQQIEFSRSNIHEQQILKKGRRRMLLQKKKIANFFLTSQKSIRLPP